MAREAGGSPLVIGYSNFKSLVCCLKNGIIFALPLPVSDPPRLYEDGFVCACVELQALNTSQYSQEALEGS